MGGRYYTIDEVSKSILGTFDFRGEAVDFVAAAMAVNADDFLDELTISNDTGPLFYGDSLREALRRREEARERVASRRANSGYSGHEPSVEAMAAKGRSHEPTREVAETAGTKTRRSSFSPIPAPPSASN